MSRLRLRAEIKTCFNILKDFELLKAFQLRWAQSKELKRRPLEIFGLGPQTGNFAFSDGVKIRVFPWESIAS